MTEMRRIRDGKYARNGMGMRVRRISVGLWGIWVEIQKMMGIRVRCRESRWKLKYSVEITWNSNGKGKLKD